MVLSRGSTTSVPVPPRDTRLDILRGWLQLTIFVSHAGTAWLHAWLVYGAWGLSDSSEQFVFLSGYVLGSVFARRAVLRGWRDAAGDMLRRTVRLYWRHLVVFVLFGIVVLTADIGGWVPGGIDRLGWRLALDEPAHAAAGALGLLWLPRFMDILPVFIWCMLLLPPFVALVGVAGPYALAAPAGLYAAVWLFGLRLPSVGGAATGFNPLAWQALFLIGAYLGRRALLRQPPSRLVGRLAPWMTWFSAAVILAGLGLRLGWYGILPWPPAAVAGARIFDKADLGLPLMIHALALTWLVSRIVPRQADWMDWRPLRWLAAVGRYSLQVFCLGLFLSWGVATALRAWEIWWIELLLVSLGMAALILYARNADAATAGRAVARIVTAPHG